MNLIVNFNVKENLCLIELNIKKEHTLKQLIDAVRTFKLLGVVVQRQDTLGQYNP